ncbi:hypothetical protein RhiirC2_793531, partial [Rhizophagus irregularis]
MEYITLTKKEGEEKYPSSRKVRIKNYEKIKEKSEGLLDTTIVLIRYRNKPDYMKIGIKLIIKVICEYYMFDEKDNLLIDNKVEENLLGNRELITYNYIIEDDKLDIRFLRFEEYNNYVKPWKDDDLTDRIIGKLIETKGFVKEYDNIEELVSSNEEDDVSENLSEEDENFEMIMRNYWLEN